MITTDVHKIYIKVAYKIDECLHVHNSWKCLNIYVLYIGAIKLCI